MVFTGCGNLAQVGCVTVTIGAGAIAVVAALEVRTSVPLEAELLGVASLEGAPLEAAPLEAVSLEAALLEAVSLETAGVSGVSVTDCVVLALQAVIPQMTSRGKNQRIRSAF